MAQPLNTNFGQGVSFDPLPRYNAAPLRRWEGQPARARMPKKFQDDEVSERARRWRLAHPPLEGALSCAEAWPPMPLN